MIALTVAVLMAPAAIAWRLGLPAAVLVLVAGAWGLSVHAAQWQAQHRADVHAQAPIDFRSLDRAAQADARAAAGAITGLAKVVGWLPIAVPGLGAMLVLGIARHRRRHPGRYQGSGSTTSLDASK